MSWLEKLCYTYSSVVGHSEEKKLIPVGFIEKKVKYRITLSQDGKFLNASELAENEQDMSIPSTPKAESRTTADGQPFPLAEQLKYFVKSGDKSLRLEKYLKELEGWCAEPDAPDCIKTVYTYLSTSDILDDMTKISMLPVKYDRETEGEDRGSFVSFNVIGGEYAEPDICMRGEVIDSWNNHLMNLMADKTDLCYVEGKKLPITDSFQKLSGNSKLISAKDSDFPFQYRGRFAEEKSSALLSFDASAKIHSTYKWLLDRQGDSRYGTQWLVWNTNGFKMSSPLDVRQEYEGQADEDDEQIANVNADTFMAYAQAVKSAAAGRGNRMRDYSPERANDVVILGLQAATPGRVSVVYEQEFPGGEYISNLEHWYDSCCWSMYSYKEKCNKVSSPYPRQIARAVLGSQTVSIADADKKCSKSATKVVRRLYKCLMGCIVERRPLPEDMLKQAYGNAISPLGFQKKGKSAGWNGSEWLECVAVSCAMIRKYFLEKSDKQFNLDTLYDIGLDETLNERSYLYGRLLALAHELEIAQTDDRSNPTNAVRMMQRLALRPCETWERLHRAILPYLQRLEANKASWYQKLIGEVESLFEPMERCSDEPLSYMFLAGFACQRAQIYTPADKLPKRKTLPAPSPVIFDRATRFGAMLAVADMAELYATDGKRAGSTNALMLVSPFARNPSRAWANVHSKLIPYFEKLGEKSAHYQRMLAKIEAGFKPDERANISPLKPHYLYGYYTTRRAILAYGADQGMIAEENGMLSFSPKSREELYGSLLGIADMLERWALNENETVRSTNALRMMTAFSQRPASVWKYLRAKLEPYVRRLGHKSDKFCEQIRLLESKLEANDNKPLSGEFLNSYYIASFVNQKNIKE